MPLSFDDLPPELIGAIFDYLPRANDRRRLSQVCKAFYQVVRGQSTKFGTLYLTKTAPDKSPVQVFKNSTFPFSKLHVEFADPDIIQDHDFWQEHGQCIIELEINDRISNCPEIPSIPFNWLTFFPYLKKLKLCQFSKLLIEENAPIIHLPVEELCIEYGFKLDEICYILQCCPSLKSFEFTMITRGYFQHWVELLPWIESIETVKVYLQQEVELKEIEGLPSKVVIQFFVVSSDVTAESLASFFNKPRRIDTLVFIHSFVHELELVHSMFTKDKILQLLKAESIKRFLLYGIVPDFPGSLDLLCQVPGLQEIEISFGLNNMHLPLYWSNPNTASKIRNVEFQYRSYPEALTGLSSLSSLTIGMSDGNLEVVRNHPKLKKLVIRSFDHYCGLYPLGDAELEPISSLHDLEILEFKLMSNITLDAFKATIKFPKLKRLVIYSGTMDNEVATLLPENCPNLEELELGYFKSVQHNDSLNDTVYEHLIRTLPYLKKIYIYGQNFVGKPSLKKEQQMQKEFPYLNK